MVMDVQTESVMETVAGLGLVRSGGLETETGAGVLATADLEARLLTFKKRYR